MPLAIKQVFSHGFRISISGKDGREEARAYVYIMRNDLHERPFALLEDVFVRTDLRGQGLGTQVIQTAIRKAREERCYKLILTSQHERERVHTLYLNLNFLCHGLEFRMDLD